MRCILHVVFFICRRCSDRVGICCIPVLIIQIFSIHVCFILMISVHAYYKGKYTGTVQ